MASNSQVGPRPPSDAIRFGDCSYDPHRRELRRGGAAVEVTTKAFDLLGILIDSRPRVLTKNELKDRLWPGIAVGDTSLAKLVTELRQATSDDAREPHYIRTVHRYGYAFCGEVLREPLGTYTEAIARRRVHIVVLASAAVGLLLAIGVWMSRRGPPKPAEEPRITSLAILPLKNLTGDPAHDYFADGMTDALSATFSRMGGVTIVSSTSASRYRDTSKPAPEIARELGVDALLEGSVLRHEDRVRVNAALVHGRSGRRLWAQTYDRHLTDILALYGDLAQTAAREMSVVLTDSQRARVARPGTVNAQAYDEYLRGTYLMNRWMAGGCPKAETHFLNAIAVDPRFAQPQAALVWCYVFPDRMQRPIGELAPKARALADQALALDPTLASAHVGLGLIRNFIDYDWDGAERAFQRALELDPGSALGHNAYGDFLYMRGRGGESIAMHKRAIQLDPFSPNNRVGFAWGLLNLRRYDEAIEQLRSALELEPGFAAAQLGLALNFGLKGERDQAVSAHLDWLDQVLLPDRAPQARRELESAYARSGWQAFWRKDLALCEEGHARPGTVSKRQYPFRASSVGLALSHVRVGQRDAALTQLERAYEERNHLVAGLNSNPLWDGLRGEPRFHTLVRRIGLAP